DKIVYGLIDARRQETDHAPDLLSMLMQARDEETGEGLSDRNLRDEMVTLLAAGHETTANALTWMWYLLSKHPDVERRLHTELASVLGGRTPSLQDLPRLKYTTMVIKEAMRLYPPIWVMQRKVVNDDEIGNYTIPAGSEVTISPYVMHRHPAFWENPEAFDPDRFSDERSVGRPRYVYLPFGGGPRLCVGHHFAMIEAQLITAMVAQAYHLDLVPGHPVEPRPWISLRPRQGLLMTLRQKASHQSLYTRMAGDDAPGARCPAFTVSA
ncbi:MAG: cytochrome P450, partial [bacterium]